MTQIKRCGACQQVKSKSDFNRHPTNQDGRQGVCRACESATWSRRRHGLTRVEKALIAEEQGGCLLCRTRNPGTHGWVVDHDHRCCGPVKSCARCRRGVLCQSCNTALGAARDDPDLLRRMADYLEEHRRKVQSSDSVD